MKHSLLLTFILGIAINLSAQTKEPGKKETQSGTKRQTIQTSNGPLKTAGYKGLDSTDLKPGPEDQETKTVKKGRVKKNPSGKRTHQYKKKTTSRRTNMGTTKTDNKVITGSFNS